MAQFHVACFRDEYCDILNQVAALGLKRSPRGRPTRDLGFTTIYVHDIAQPVLPLHTGRGIGKTVAALETLQVIGGVSTPDLLIQAAPRFADFTEPTAPYGKPYFHGAYGTRIGTQLTAALDKLQSDADTRQAVITLWDPVLDNQNFKRDYPCTVALGLALVDGRLQLTVLMRSNDAWLGLPNDVFVFTQLQWTLAHALGVEPGNYIHTAWSLHLYEHNLSDVEGVSAATREEYQPRGLICSTYPVARELARRMLRGETFKFCAEGGEDDGDWLRWYRGAIAPGFEPAAGSTHVG